jgi:NADH:ubiquinone oxidoreductase subunit F (NADH-binding)
MKKPMDKKQIPIAKSKSKTSREALFPACFLTSCSLGSGDVLIMRLDIVDTVARIAELFEHESSGKCLHI